MEHADGGLARSARVDLPDQGEDDDDADHARGDLEDVLGAGLAGGRGRRRTPSPARPAGRRWSGGARGRGARRWCPRAAPGSPRSRARAPEGPSTALPLATVGRLSTDGRGADPRCGGRTRTAAPAGARASARRRSARRTSRRRRRRTPSLSTTERGHSSRAYGRSWVTIRTVTSSERRMSASSRREAGSRLDDGSSRTRISGSIASTVATATRRRWPKDRWCGGRSAKSAMPTWSSARWTHALELGAREPEVGRAERDVLADRGHEQLVVGVLEDDADPAPDLGEVVLRRPAAR